MIKLEELIIKYYTSSLTKAETDTLLRLLEDPKNQKLFKKYTRDYYNLELGLQHISLEDEFSDLWKEMESRKRKQLVPRQYFRMAAVFVLLLSLGGLLFWYSGDSQEIINENAVQITLGDGTVKILEEAGKTKLVGAKGQVIGVQQGNSLDYKNPDDSSESRQEKLTFNELTVPYGKKFHLVLSDGTKIYLNSGSTLKYPQKFMKGNTRQVFLEGEGYFSVAKDINHTFIVTTGDMDVRVLGTEFNVSSYTEDSTAHTVLVEGAVSIYEKDNKFYSENGLVMEPGYKAEMNKNSGNISLEKVDTEIYTGWTEGKIIFKNTPFTVIRKKLERHYNVSIQNNNKALDEKTYNAVFDIESIEQVLKTLNEHYPIEYTYKKNEIIIN